MKLIQKGFTLIELLIVIAVIGVLAAIVVAAIDPVDKINAANDAKVKSDIATIATGLETYATNNNGTYPTTAQGLGVLTTSGELKAMPAPPAAAWCATYTAGYAADANHAGGFQVTCNLKSKKSLADSGAATAVRKYETATGKSCTVATAATVCP